MYIYIYICIVLYTYRERYIFELPEQEAVRRVLRDLLGQPDEAGIR